MSKPYVKVLNSTDKNRCNCVLWVRDRVPSFPFGMWNINDKKKIINSKKAKEGRVAIMNVGVNFIDPRTYLRVFSGHVGIVKEVGKNHITIQEANYKTCKVTERHGTEKDLKILGYFNPNK